MVKGHRGDECREVGGDVCKDRVDSIGLVSEDRVGSIVLLPLDNVSRTGGE